MPVRKRELINPRKGDKRPVRGSAKARSQDVDDVDRSPTQDRRREAKSGSEHPVAVPKGKGIMRDERGQVQPKDKETAQGR
jgi:hypothetical protein